MYILSQVLVAISDVFCILSMLVRKKSNVVFYLILSTIFFAIHYLCLGGFTGMAMAFLELLFLIVMFIIESKNLVKYNIYVVVITMVLTIILSIVTWSGIISLLPMFAMLIYLTTMIFTNVVIVKSGVFIRIVLNAIYMLLLSSYLGASLSAIIIAFSIYGIVSDYKKGKAGV